MYAFGSGDVGGEGGKRMRGLSLGFTILWEQGECWACICVRVAVVLVVYVGVDMGLGPRYVGVGWCVCVSLDSLV